MVSHIRAGLQAVRLALAAVGQQGWFMSPQPAHLPPVHAPTGAPQLVPLARQVPLMQQPPAPQTSPAQHS
jgi:hypothetical protein